MKEVYCRGEGFLENRFLKVRYDDKAVADLPLGAEPLQRRFEQFLLQRFVPWLRRHIKMDKYFAAAKTRFLEFNVNIVPLGTELGDSIFHIKLEKLPRIFELDVSIEEVTLLCNNGNLSDYDGHILHELFHAADMDSYKPHINYGLVVPERSKEYLFMHLRGEGLAVLRQKIRESAGSIELQFQHKVMRRAIRLVKRCAGMFGTGLLRKKIPAKFIIQHSDDAGVDVVIILLADFFRGKGARPVIRKKPRSSGNFPLDRLPSLVRTDFFFRVEKETAQKALEEFMKLNIDQFMQRYNQACKRLCVEVLKIA